MGGKAKLRDTHPEPVSVHPILDFGGVERFIVGTVHLHAYAGRVYHRGDQKSPTFACSKTRDVLEGQP